jgi:hypothetical protein
MEILSILIKAKENFDYMPEFYCCSSSVKTTELDLLSENCASDNPVTVLAFARFY